MRRLQQISTHINYHSWREKVYDYYTPYISNSSFMGINWIYEILQIKDKWAQESFFRQNAKD
jgi:hypothetical protein